MKLSIQVEVDVGDHAPSKSSVAHAVDDLLKWVGELKVGNNFYPVISARLITAARPIVEEPS